MTTVPQTHERPEAPLFCDGLGDRVVAADGATGELLQILRIRPALTAVPSFEFALRERAARLANFRHAYYARVRRIDRVQVPAPGLAIVFDHVEGTRLSDILRVAQERRLQLDINAALCLIRQLVPAVALLHENAREVAHGLIAPERLIVTPHARLVIVEHVLAAAVEQLQYGRERLWQEFRIAMAPSAGAPRFDHRADVTGIGLVALALVLGRPLAADEFPHKLATLLNDARARTSLGDEQPLSAPLRDWIGRALQLDVRRAFASAPEAMSALEDVLAEDASYVPAPVALETFLSRYIAALLDPTPIEPMPVAPAAVVPVPPPSVVPESPRPIAAPVPSALESFDPPRPSAPFASSTSRPVPAPPPAAASAAPPSPVAAPAPPGAQPSGAGPAVAAPAPPRAEASPVAPPLAAPAVAAPAAPSTASPLRDITDLIPASDLASTLPKRADAPKSLFDPDAPFTFPSEQAMREPRKKAFGAKRRLMIAAAAAVVIAAAAIPAWRYFVRTSVPSPAMGTLAVQSNPAGVQVFVDGIDRGLTPARLSVTPGAHILELRGRGVPRVIPFNVTAGAEVSQYLEFAETPQTGQLEIQSQPAGAKVFVDGVEKGAAPITVAELTPGEHEVILQTEAGSVRHVVSVQAGGTASLVAPVVATDAAAGPVSAGWLSVKAPFSIEIREGGRLLGSSDADRLMMTAGRHELELVNDTLGYRQARVVNVVAGKVASLKVDLPNGVVNLNALPWAEVWIDGQRVGETPIGNLAVPIGPHEVVFRNPQFGEKRHAISVTLGQPVRLSVDMK